MKVTKELLATLSKEQKLLLYDAVVEKKRRQRERKPSFNPHAGQLRVIRSKALERYLFCGNGFGKSTVLVNEVHWAATGFNPVTGEHTPVPAKICLVIDTPEKIDEFIREYRVWNTLEEKQLHKKGKPNFSFISYDNGSSVSVMTHEVSDLKPEGSQWTHLFFDEPPPQHLFTGLFRGGRIKGRPVKVLLAGTPVKAAWLRSDVYEPYVNGEAPHVECFTGLSEENKANLEDGWLERFGSKLSEKEKRIRLAGEFFDVDGQALAHLIKPTVHVLSREAEWNSDWPCVVVFDPAPAKAHVAVMVGVDDQDLLYVVKEYKEKANARVFAENVIAEGWFHNHRVVDIIYDSLGSSENLMGESYKPFGTILNEVLKEHGIGKARATSFDEKSDEDFIERIRDVLVIPEDGTPPKLRFFPDCKGSYNDVKTVQWYEDKQLKENKTKLDLRKKDFLACVKYALATNIYFHKARKTTYYRNTSAYGMKLASQVAAASQAQSMVQSKNATRLRKFQRRGKAKDDDDDF